MPVDLQQISELLGPMFQAIASDGAAVMATLGLPDDAKVLDVGTGEGNFAIFLAASGYEVVTGEPASDTSHYAGKNWHERAVKAKVLDRIHFEAFAGDRMPFPERTFDAVFFFGVLHHIDEKLRKDTFREAMRVAKDNGAAVFFEPKKETLERVWVDDPTHPVAVCPSDYASEYRAGERRMTGSMMDVFIFIKS